MTINRILTLSFRLTLVLSSTFLIPACSRTEVSTDTPSLSVTSGEAYTKGEIIKLAELSARDLEMPEAKQQRVLKKLDRVLNDMQYKPKLREDIDKTGVTGVIAYRLGEGGAVLTVKSGKAVGRLKGDQSPRTYRLSGVDLGAQLAASREWGVALVLGLREGEDLRGTYRGMDGKVVAGGGQSNATMHAKRGMHRIVLLGAGAGVSLGVKGAKLKVKKGK